ncbi:xylose isomerase [Serinibacter arcticus]|uniref:Xylose isomerase n=1 Tax=Serinibacter arcticus TaxID=1655435 RepID=A0A2U1ZW41_9MICO|nr:sugar phosphate isomerase/epimerase family protein [Serinibacter arcticus]PWD51198.1 xylose isomerase [Serinibacter arcticus]
MTSHDTTTPPTTAPRSTTPLTATTWPIAAATLAFGGPARDGGEVHDAPAAEWGRVLRAVARAGFDHVDLTDAWLRPGDLAPSRRPELLDVAAEHGVALASISAIRRSVIHASDGEENLAYSHRTIDAAAGLGIGTVSVGLHQALTPAQQRELWFWTVTGHEDDPAHWDLAVERLRELGRHAADVGVVLSLEMYEDTFLGTAASSVRLVEEIGLPEVGLNPDIGNLVRLHRPIEDWREAFELTLPWTNFWHVKNYSRDEDVARDAYTAVPALMETGLINYRWAVQRAVELGFQGVICTEHYGGDGLSVSASNRDYLRRVLPEEGDVELGVSRVLQPRLTTPTHDRAGVAS